MHELKIAEEMASIVLEAASREKLTSVSRVKVNFGIMVQIVPEIFEFAFRECVRGTVAADAGVYVEIMPVRVKCNDCSLESDLPSDGFRCNNCGSQYMQYISGQEMYIKSIEGE